MFRKSARLAVIFIAAATFASAIPWPPNDKFPYPGAPQLADGAFTASTTDPLQPYVKLSFAGEYTSQKLGGDGAISTGMRKITSYECIDDHTFRYIFEGTTYPEGAPIKSCAITYINATHSFFRGVNKGAGDCPDDPFEKDGFEADPTNQLLGSSIIFNRVDGVLPGPPVLICKNSSKPFTYPPDPTTYPETLALEPIDVTFPYGNGAVAATGVWKSQGLIEIINPTAFAAAILTNEGGVIGSNGRYQASNCLGDGSSYIGSTKQDILYQNGTVINGYGCEKGTRSTAVNGVEKLTINVTDSCEPFTNPNAPAGSKFAIYEFELIQNIGDLPTQCTSDAKWEKPRWMAIIAIFMSLSLFT